MTRKFEDGHDVVKMLDENFDERKNHATSWDKLWRSPTLFYPLVDKETFFLRHTSRPRFPDPVSTVYALVLKANEKEGVRQ